MHTELRPLRRRCGRVPGRCLLCCVHSGEIIPHTTTWRVSYLRAALAVISSRCHSGGTCKGAVVYETQPWSHCWKFVLGPKQEEQNVAMFG